CGMPNDRSKCSFFEMGIGSIRHGSHQLLQRDPPQISMSIFDGFRLIDPYVQQFMKTNRYGYYIKSTSVKNLTVSETAVIYIQSHTVYFLHKIFDHLSSNNVYLSAILYTNIEVIQSDKHIEQTIVLLHIQAIPDDAKQYRLSSSDFIRENNAEPSFSEYINELVENNQQYPLLNFLPVTRSNNDIPLCPIVPSRGDHHNY
ncbi:unnamed protein product, partial [Didymodactylos carnosus]